MYPYETTFHRHPARVPFLLAGAVPAGGGQAGGRYSEVGEGQLMDIVRVMTPCGPGIIWGIGPGKVLVEMDHRYLVEFEPDQVERMGKSGLHKNGNH